MKRHTAILLTLGLCLLALMSCAPVEYPSPLERNVVEDKPVIYVTPHAKKADISFTPVRNADSYKITLNGEVMSVPLKVKDGLYTFTLRKLTPTTPYELKITAVNTKGELEAKHSFNTTEDTGELDYAPLAYMSERTETSVTVSIRQLPKIGYRITFEKNGVPDVRILPSVDTATTKTITFDSIEEKATYSIKVEHGQEKNGKVDTYSTDTTELTIPHFRANFAKDLILEFDSAKGTARISRITVEGSAPSDLSDMKFMTLLFYPDESGIPVILETVEIKDINNLEMSIRNLGGLRSGLFDIVLTKAKGIDPIYSQPKFYTTPVMPDIDQNTSHQKSVTLTWTQPDDMEDIIYTVSGTSKDSNRWTIKPSEVEVTGNKATLTLDDLVSNTEYELHIEALLPNEEKSNTTYIFKTDTFSGVYRWICPTPNAVVPSFVIEVWDHDDAVRKGWAENWNDKYPYHVFVHESDPAYTKEMEGIAIMPLFRGKDAIPTEFISYSENDTHYKQGYHWNEMKWNATGKIHPSAWLPDTERDVHGPDTRTSYTLSKALGTLTTKTDFTFRVKDGKPQIVFRNAGDGKGANTVNIGLFKNPSPEPGTDKFTYVLNRIGSVE